VLRDASAATSTIHVIAGPVKQGMVVKWNNQAVALHQPITIGVYTFVQESAFEMIVESSEFNLRISNSDMFLNQDVSIGSELMARISQYKRLVKSGDVDGAAAIEAKLPHGILGQTWSPEVYANRWKHIDGQLFDYQLDSLNSTSFKFSKF